jgi:ribosomal protein L7/L12
MDLSTNAQKVFDLVKDLSAIELVALVKKMEEEFGVSAAAVAVA